MPYLRAVVIWLGIIAAETVHGILREVVLTPVMGDFRARQVGVVTGSALILFVAWATVGWLSARSRGQLLLVGLIWVVLTIAFELVLGRLVLNRSWDRLLEDYNLAEGGLLGLGLLVMLFAPLMTARLRGTKASNIN